jgi:hypothetical protein
VWGMEILLGYKSALHSSDTAGERVGAIEAGSAFRL